MREEERITRKGENELELEMLKERKGREGRTKNETEKNE